MTTIIYYFTGTGNSLAAANKIAAALGDCELVPIALLQNTTGKILPPAERIGIVTPVYDAGLPRIVAEFLPRLDLAKVTYCFGIITLGGTGISALHQMNGILKTNGRALDAAFEVKMPGNFPPVKKIEPEENLAKCLNAAEKRLSQIAEMIRAGTHADPAFSPVSSLMRALIYRPFYNRVHESGSRFSVTDACTSCGTCTKICPTRNIILEKGRPAWQHQCELCCACLNFCPAEAIQLNMLFGTKGRGRYHHPEIKIADMNVQRGE